MGATVTKNAEDELADNSDDEKILFKVEQRAGQNSPLQKRICKEKGVTGETIILYRLYDLCGFDPVKDLTIDAMRAIVLNLVRTELSILLSDFGRNSSRSKILIMRDAFSLVMNLDK